MLCYEFRPLPMGPDIKTPDTFGDISQPNAASFTIILSDDQMQLINGYETGEATTSSFAAENVNVIPVESSSNDGTVPSTSAMCKICKKLLATKRSLSTHMSVMHRMEGNTPISHECQSCHKAYRTPYNLRRHKCKARGD